ncbi:enolase-like domain-containing protein [Cyclobacterium amurskyense]|uniref:hypothetical protein n=1 Tax=Cyclobacterium amurskyense TaxID=320787 RepID=UPI001F0B4EBB|nr:hypothetical protein [Cyclobacterium amurskyense]
MDTERRKFIKKATLASTLGALGVNTLSKAKGKLNEIQEEEIDMALKAPVLITTNLTSPVWIKSIELLRKENNFICRVKSNDGAEGISVSNNMQMKDLYPIFIHRIQPFFIGKDARDWERLLDEVYVYQSNYKLQSLALWVPLATLEFAVLDLLGKLANKKYR